MKFHHIAISTENLIETVAWYQNLFGFKETHRTKRETMEIVLLDLDGVALEIFQLTEPLSQPEHEQDLMEDLRRTGVRHFAIQVQNLEETLRVFVDRGVEQVTAIKEPFYGGKYSFIKDNNGILVELVEAP